MPRIIGCEKNEIVFEDPISGDKLGLYYRMPTPSEREGFLNMAIQRSGNEVAVNHTGARLTYGRKILVGIREGDFQRMKDGKAVPMSSDPASQDYYPEWAREMEDGCADLIMAMAGHVFDRAPSLAAKEKLSGK